jgi:PBP1b-binding outer membrane lipoprotein LpoB
MYIRSLSSIAAVTLIALSLSACGEDEKAETEAPKKVEKTQPAPAQKSSKDMTPSEAMDNMKRDAGIVADKAKEGYNAAKKAVGEAYENAKESVQKEQTETTSETSDQKMTPGEAVDNMKRDAGIVADKAKEGYNAAKEAVTKALSE